MIEANAMTLRRPLSAPAASPSRMPVKRSTENTISTSAQDVPGADQSGERHAPSFRDAMQQRTSAGPVEAPQQTTSGTPDGTAGTTVATATATNGQTIGQAIEAAKVTPLEAAAHRAATMKSMLLTGNAKQDHQPKATATDANSVSLGTDAAAASVASADGSVAAINGGSTPVVPGSQAPPDNPGAPQVGASTVPVNRKEGSSSQSTKLATKDGEATSAATVKNDEQAALLSPALGQPHGKILQNEPPARSETNAGANLSLAPVGSLVTSLAGGHIAGATRAPANHPTGEKTAGNAPDFAPEMRTTVSATPTSLEVGVSSGVHGWLKIRAELTETGSVSAQMTAPTALAAEHLHRELPALSAFLASEHVGVSDLFVHAAERQAGTQDAMAGAGTAPDKRQQPPADDAERTAGLAFAENANDVERGWPRGFAIPAAMLPGVGMGGWLSVRV